jgi:hypothetical protein
MINSDNRSRRNFIKKAGGLSVGLAGTSLLTGCTTSEVKTEIIKPGTLFSGKPVSNEDRIERVKTAALGMQRYDWEQGTVGQALLEMGEPDLAISFARGAIMRQEKGRFSIMKGNGPITDWSKNRRSDFQKRC